MPINSVNPNWFRNQPSFFLFINMQLITSRISGRGYRNGAVCVSVCVSVSEHSHSWTDWHTVTKFGTGIDLDGILDKFDGQRQRSKVKVTRSRNLISMIFWLQCQYTKCWPMVWHYDVMWRHGTTSWHHSMTSSVFLLWDRFGTQEVQQHFSVFLLLKLGMWALRHKCPSFEHIPYTSIG